MKFLLKLESLWWIYLHGLVCSGHSTLKLQLYCSNQRFFLLAWSSLNPFNIAEFAYPFSAFQGLFALRSALKAGTGLTVVIYFI